MRHSPDSDPQTRSARHLRLRLGRQEVRLVGEGAAAAGPPPGRDVALEARLRRFEPLLPRDPLAVETDLHEAGRGLASAFLPQGVVEALALTLGEIGAAKVEVFLGLEIVEQDLELLPWELLWLPGAAQPLALMPGVRLYRHVVFPEAALPPPVPVAGPLSLLVVVASPLETPLLDMEYELTRILAALEPLRRQTGTRVRILERGSLAAIRTALLEEPCHILHVTCHAAPGVLLLEDEEGSSDPVPADRLAESIPASPPAFVILAGCSTADPQGAQDDRFLPGIAQDLVQRGIPSVLAMHGRVSDRYATDFVARLFADLVASQRPDPIRSLATARQSVEVERRSQLGTTRQAPEWPTPVLFISDRRQPLLPSKPSSPAAGIGLPWRLAEAASDREFIGRRGEIRWLLERMLAPDSVGVEIRGIGGVGKSALARQVLHRLDETGWPTVTLASPFSVEDLLSAIAGRLARTAFSPDLLAAARDPHLLAALLPTVRLAIFLDGFEAELDERGTVRNPALRAFLRRWLESPGRSRLLVASRLPVDWAVEPQPAMAKLDLGPLSPAETRKLFWHLPELKELPEKTLATIFAELGGHPGTLRRLAVAWEPTGEITEHSSRLSSWLAEAASQTAEKAGVESLLIRLTPMARELLERASLYRLPVDREGLLFQVADGVEDQETALFWPTTRRDAPDTLYLLQTAIPTAATFRDALPTDPAVPHTPLSWPLPEPEELQAAITTLVRLELLHHPVGWQTLGRELYQVHSWLAAVLRQSQEEEHWRRAHFRAAIYWRWQARHPSLLEPIYCLLEARHHYKQAGKVASAVAVNEWVCAQLHLWSFWERERQLCRETLGWLPDRSSGTAALEHELGVIAHEQGSYDEARGWYERALATSRGLGDRPAEARTLHELGALAQTRGRLDEAEQWLRQALDLKRLVAEPAAAASTLTQLAALAQQRGRSDEAATLLSEALALETEERDEVGRAKVLHRLASLELERGSMEHAEELYLEAARIFEQHGDRASFAASLHQLGVLAQRRKSYDEAFDRFHQAVALEKEIEDRLSLANTRYQLGQLALEVGSFSEALRELREAQSLYEELGDGARLARTLLQRGEIEEIEKRPAEAEQLYSQAAALFSENGASTEARATWRRLGKRLLERLDALPESTLFETFAQLAQALEWTRKGSDDALTAGVLRAYGRLLDRSGRTEDEAVEARIREIPTRDPQIRAELAEIRRQQKRYREAIELGRAVAEEGRAPSTARVRALYTTGEAELALGSERGLAELSRGLELARKMRDRALAAEGYLRVGNARLLQQEFEDARNSYLMAASLYRQLDLPEQVALCYRLLILLSRQVGREHDAEQFHKLAEGYFHSIGHPEWATESLAELRLKAG
jgi:tetratricopeptide (TPR) repeat protein